MARSSSPPIVDRASAERALLEHMASADYQPLPQRELLHRLHVPADARPMVRRLIKELIQEGRIARVRGNRLGPSGSSASGQTIRGRLERHPTGFGFVIPEGGGEDVFVPPRALGDAMHGDTVAVRVSSRGGRGKREGTVVEVLDSRSRVMLGLFRAESRGGVVQPFDPEQGFAVRVAEADAAGAVDGEAVSVEVLEPPRGDGRAAGRILEVLGPIDKPGVDVLVVARRHGLPLQFPEEVLDAAARLPEAVPREEAAQRERFDDPAPVTIDGETARDFDDAIAVVERPSGGFRLFVHIADVGHFVRTGDALDREARARGTSVYFPDRVLPMFPEKLSNDLCSLRAGEDRLVQSAVLDLDADGAMQSVRFADGVIRSAARLTYTQVAAVIAGKGRALGVPEGVVAMLCLADRLRERLESRRHARGSVDFDLPEPRILLDVEGVMTGITIEPRNEAHRLIEECMLAANDAVAAHLERAEAPCLYRIHEPPDPLKVETLKEFVKGFGLSLEVDPRRIRPRDIQALTESAEGRPEYPVIAQVALRSMKQARYSPENLGHFGLASPVYCHFTSPIRRYPDLMVHRFLRAHRQVDGARLDRLAQGLPELAEQCSRLERTAEAAERELLAWKKIAFMREREGESFDGIVTGVANFGLFVQLTETLVEGLLRVEGLGDDLFDHVEGRQELLGRRTGRSFRLGQRIRVVVRRVDAVLRRVDLALDEQGEAVPSSPRRGSPRTARARSAPATGSAPARRRDPARSKPSRRRR